MNGTDSIQQKAIEEARTRTNPYHTNEINSLLYKSIFRVEFQTFLSQLSLAKRQSKIHRKYQSHLNQADKFTDSRQTELFLDRKKF